MPPDDDDDLPPDDTPRDDDPPGLHRGGRGRPPKLTPERLSAAVTLLLRGNFRSAVVRAIGVTPRTFRRWMAAGERFPDGIYGQLRRSVSIAEAQAEANAVAIVQAAARDDAKHAEWFLERKYPQRWGRGRGELVEIKRQIRELEKAVRQADQSEGAAEVRPTPDA